MHVVYVRSLRTAGVDSRAGRLQPAFAARLLQPGLAVYGLFPGTSPSARHGTRQVLSLLPCPSDSAAPGLQVHLLALPPASEWLLSLDAPEEAPVTQPAKWSPDSSTVVIWSQHTDTAWLWAPATSDIMHINSFPEDEAGACNLTEMCALLPPLAANSD